MKEVIGKDIGLGGAPASDHGDLRADLDAIEGDASHMPMVLRRVLKVSLTSSGMVWFSCLPGRRAFNCYPVELSSSSVHELSPENARQSYASTLAPGSTPKL